MTRDGSHVSQLNRVYTFVDDVHGFARGEDHKRRVAPRTSNEALSPALVTAVVTSQPSRFDTDSDADIIAFNDLFTARAEARRIRAKPITARD